MMRTYDAKKVVVTLAGIVLPGGFAEDDGIKVTPNEPEQWQSMYGQDGQVVRSKVNNSGVKVTLTLQQSSDTNDILSRLLNQDLEAVNGQGIGAFQLTDLNGNTIIRGPQAWIVGFPEVTRGKTAKTNAWVIEVANVNQIVGGNTVAT
jgi:hypothetical protein